MECTALYMDDMLLKEWEAKVMSVKDDKFIVLDKTAFYPASGGVECDTGLIVGEDGKNRKVVFVGKFGGSISHEIAGEPLKEGEIVKCSLDWPRRYLLMRYHTAAHVLSGMLAKDAGAKITGNQLTTEKGRIDFDLETFDKEYMIKIVEKANELVGQNLPVETYYLPRDEALKDPNMVKLAGAMPPEVTNLRVVDIKGFDYQADGGCHVSQLKEVGKIVFVSAENKGKSNRRFYFRLED